VKWVHQVYQAILFTGVIGLELVLINFLFDLLMNTGLPDNSRLLLLAVIVVSISFPIIGVWKRDEVTGAPWLPILLLKKSGVKQNINNRLIETFYISKLVELRNKKVRFCEYCGEELPFGAIYCSRCGRQ
jgi:hypothetical protein